jgi:hypothetical protein
MAGRPEAARMAINALLTLGEKVQHLGGSSGACRCRDFDDTSTPAASSRAGAIGWSGGVSHGVAGGDSTCARRTASPVTRRGAVARRCRRHNAALERGCVSQPFDHAFMSTRALIWIPRAMHGTSSRSSTRRGRCACRR